MISRSDFAYVQARIQSRHGERPDADAWARLHASRDLGHLLEAARSTGLARWVEQISVRSEPHAIERALRRELRDHVEEVASWTPHPWQPAVRWLSRLADLPALERLLGAEPPPPWMADDPALRNLALDDRDARTEAMRAAGLGEIVDAVERGQAARLAWAARFVELVPLDVGRRGEIEDLLAAFVAHVERLEEAGADEDGWELRRELREELEHAFRWNALHPVALFAHLMLVALDLERLRGAILRRRLFPQTRSEVSWV